MVRLESTISAQAFEVTSATSERAATTPKKMNDGRDAADEVVDDGMSGPIGGGPSTAAGAPATDAVIEGILALVGGTSVLDSLIGGAALLRHKPVLGHQTLHDHRTFV
jgi:hypothetical protein